MYLFPFWLAGLFIRYLILFPLRLLGLIVGWLLFFIFFPVVKVRPCVHQVATQPPDLRVFACPRSSRHVCVTRTPSVAWSNGMSVRCCCSRCAQPFAHSIVGTAGS